MWTPHIYINIGPFCITTSYIWLNISLHADKIQHSFNHYNIDYILNTNISFMILSLLNCKTSYFNKSNIRNVWITPICGYDACTVVPAAMLVPMQKSYSWQYYFQILSIFLYGIFCWPPAGQHSMVAYHLISYNKWIHQ